MPSLKSLRTRITSVKSTRKITSAMKMVSAAKLRRAQEQAQAARPYAERMERMLGSLASSFAGVEGGPALLAGTGKDQTHLIVAISSDRGLCGGFNGAIVREARRYIARVEGEGKTVRVLTVGRKGRDQLRRTHPKSIIHSYEDIGRKRLSFAEAETVTAKVVELFDAGEFDVAAVLYNKFKSAMTQIVTVQQVIPFAMPEDEQTANPADAGMKALYEFEPEEDQILADLLPKNLSIQVYRALLESAASEQGARMTAMDSATRNAGEMINKLTLVYNRTRQAVITKELIEIISGAEAT
jgi:F-type H+-transporting ATPase subunit gamma